MATEQAITILEHLESIDSHVMAIDTLFQTCVSWLPAIVIILTIWYILNQFF